MTSQVRQHRFTRAAAAAALGLAMAGASWADGGVAAAPLPAASQHQQAAALSMAALAGLIGQVNAALAGGPCAAAQASLCALVQFSVGAADAQRQAPTPMLDRCDLDGATPVCRVDLVAILAGGQRQPLAQLELAYAQGQWAPRGEAVVAGLRSGDGLQQTALR